MYVNAYSYLRIYPGINPYFPPNYECNFKKEWNIIFSSVWLQCFLSAKCPQRISLSKKKLKTKNETHSPYFLFLYIVFKYSLQIKDCDDYSQTVSLSVHI